MMVLVGKKWKKAGIMKKFKLLFSKKAKDEINISRRYYNKCRDGLGNEFTSEVKKTTKKILENPHQFPESISELRKANTSKFPFSIFYHIQDVVIKVIAVFHNSRNPENWQNRIENTEGNDVKEK